MIEKIINFLITTIDKFGYWGIALSMFVESFFAPIPSELIMPFGGFLVSQGKMNFIVLILVGGVASYIGTLPFYFMGYLGNDLIINSFIKKYGKYLFIKQSDIDRAFNAFDKYGKALVLFGRLIPMVRSFISFPAGVAKMNFLQFSAYTLVGSILWSAVLAGAGFYFGEKWELVSGYISKYEKFVFVVLGVMLLALIISKVRALILEKRTKA